MVGYAVDQATQEQLQCIARASGGSYHDATDPEGLLQALEEAMAATVVETILRVEIVGPGGAEVGGNVHLYEPGIDRLVSGYVAWKDNVVPPGTYDLLVDTLPDIFYPDLTLPEGSTTGKDHLVKGMGLREYLVPGDGDIDFAEIASYLPADALRVCEFEWYSNEEEVAKGVEVLRGAGF